MIHFMMIMHVIMMYTLWSWCTPIQCDVYAYNSVMMLSYALWCILDVDDTRCTLRWWWCIFNDDDAYPLTMMHTYDDDAWRYNPYVKWKHNKITCSVIVYTYDDNAWRCMPYVKWKHNRITCSVIVYDEVYNDVHE